MSDKKILGFIGTGVMGSSMAGHLLSAGYEVLVYNRTKAKADKLVEKVVKTIIKTNQTGKAGVIHCSTFSH